MENLAAVATPSQLTCPECGGTMSELKNTRPLRYRCHTGHAYTALSLENAQAGEASQALQASLRSLKEREMLLRRLAAVAEQLGDTAQADAGREQAERVHQQVRKLQSLIQEELRSA